MIRELVDNLVILDGVGHGAPAESLSSKSSNFSRKVWHLLGDEGWTLVDLKTAPRKSFVLEMLLV